MIIKVIIDEYTVIDIIDIIIKKAVVAIVNNIINSTRKAKKATRTMLIITIMKFCQ